VRVSAQPAFHDGIRVANRGGCNSLKSHEFLMDGFESLSVAAESHAGQQIAATVSVVYMIGGPGLH
jgi:hypothetical protein